MKPIIQQFQDDICSVVDRYRDNGLTIWEAIGAIELIKLDLWSEHNEEEDEY
jgi:hypothetical protein